MSVQLLRYFAGGNTAKGFYSLYDSNLQSLDRVFTLSGKSNMEKSKLIQRLADEWKEKGFPLEVIHAANNPETLEGLIIRKIGFGIVDGDPPRTVGKEYVGPRWETIDLNAVTDSTEENSSYDRLDAERNDLLQKAYEYYKEGLQVHDDWEELYIKRMDFNKADKVALTLINDLFTNRQKENNSQVFHRFLGAATPNGPVDFVDNITSGLSRRFFLKGRAGTGKSTILRKVVAEAEKRGYDMEIYHCGFDPESLDMVVVRELGWAIFDSTPPHEYFPERPGDEVIDMYELTVAPGTDELFESEINEIAKKYRVYMDKAKDYLVKAQDYQMQLESSIQSAVNHERLEEIFNEINNELSVLVNEMDIK